MRKSVFITCLLLLSTISFLNTSCATTKDSSTSDESLNYVDPYSVKFEPIEKRNLDDESEYWTPLQIGPNGVSLSYKDIKQSEYYKFEIGPYQSPYVIVHIINGNGNGFSSWNVLENDGSNMFSKIIQIPADATRLYISPSSTPNSYQNSVYDISISRNNASSTYITKKDTVTRVVVDAPILSPLKQKVMAGEFCQFDIDPNTSNFCIINMKINKKNNKWIALPNDGSNYFSTFQLIPSNVKEIYIAFSDTNQTYYNRSFTAKVEKSKNPYKFKTNPNFIPSLKKYKTNFPDKALISFMESINARELGKSDVFLFPKLYLVITNFKKQIFLIKNYVEKLLYSKILIL